MAEYLEDIRQGNTIKIELNYGVDTDITDFEYRLVLKKHYDDSDEDAALYHTKVAGDFEGDSPETGIVYIVLTPEETVLIPFGRYYYELVEVTPAGEVFTIVPPTDQYNDKILVAPEV
jgi:hypothetical protein